MNSIAASAQNTWHVDRSVNIAVVAGFVGSIASGIWFAATTNARIGELERMQQIAAPQADRLTRVETKLDAIHESLAEIRALINKTMVR